MLVVLSLEILVGASAVWALEATLSGVCGTVGEEELLIALKPESLINGTPGGRLVPADAFRQAGKEAWKQALPGLLGGWMLVNTAALAGAYWLARRREREKTARFAAALCGEGEPEEHDPALSRLYRQLRAKAEESTESYRRLQAYLAHEQKNHIAVLRLEKSVRENPTAALAVEAISEGVEDVLTLSDPMDSGEKQRVNVALTCAKAVTVYQNAAPIDFRFDEDADCEIWARERWVYRALCNLLDNAVKYGGGKPVQVLVGRRQNSIQVQIRDQGCGIPEAEQEKIWDYSYRVHALQQDGCGIGLSLVRHAVDLCGGFVYLESRPGHGTEFYLSFPAAEEQTSA